MYHIALSSESKQFQFTVAKHFIIIHVLRKGGENKLINLQKIFLELTIPFWYPNNPTRKKTPIIKN
jgi:hypothetical protein